MCPFNWLVFQQNCRVFLKTYLLEASKLFCIQTHIHRSQLFCIIAPQITPLFVSSDTKSPYGISWAAMSHLYQHPQFCHLCSPKHETSLVAQTVKRLLTMRETRIQSLGWEDLLEK